MKTATSESERFCPACENPLDEIHRTVAVDERGAKRIYLACRDCGCLKLDPIPAPDELARYYAQEYYGAASTKFPGWIERGIQRFRERRARRVSVGHIGHDPRILDIGCGSGAFLAAMGRHGFAIDGVERPGMAAERARAVPALRLHEGTFDTFSAPDGAYDVITLWHVLEHMPDPATVLARCHRYLKPGGRLYLDVPNGDSWQARWFGPRWLHLDPPRHLIQFTMRAMQTLLNRQTFSLVSMSSMQQEMGLFGILQSACNRGMTPRDYLYGLLRSRGRGPDSLFRKSGALLQGMIAFPFACLFLAAESLADRASVLRVVAEKPNA